MDKIRVLCSIMTRNGGLMNVILLNINAGFKMEHTGKKKSPFEINSPILEYKNDLCLCLRKTILPLIIYMVVLYL